MLNPLTNRKLLKRGEPATARIVEMIDHAHGSRPSRVRMTLEVDRPGVEPYEVRDRWRVSGTEPIGRGSELCVQVDPDRRHRLTIDWERTHAVYRDDIVKRRELMTVGVPVPVSKLRARAEEIGYEQWTDDPDTERRPDSEQLLTVVPEPQAEAESIVVAASTEHEASTDDTADEPDAASSSNDEDLTTNLVRLAALHDSGALTDGEFETAKRSLLARA